MKEMAAALAETVPSPLCTSTHFLLSSTLAKKRGSRNLSHYQIMR
jgi:hypothetical protein